MGLVQGPQWEARIVLFLFLITVASVLIAGLTGIAWDVLSLTDFSFVLIVMTFLLIISAVSVLTYSFVSFTQSREVRHLMLLLMSINIMIWAFLFLLSHPASVNWSILFSERNRNRTLVIAFILIIIPTILLGSSRGELKLSRPSVLLLIIWGAAIMPIISLALFFSRSPIFILVTSEGGIEGLTTTGVIFSIGYMFAQIIALPRIVHQWWKTRNTIDLSLMLAMVLWLLGSIFGMIAWDPLQVAEIIWVGSIIGGFFLIAMVQFVTSILYPHRNLEQLVSLRTKELNLSNQENEFYLSMWTHKMGNLLQGMITYLDILEHAAQHSEEDKDTRAAARNLSREATFVNLQVSQLTRIKESLYESLWPVNVVTLLEEAVESAEQIIGEGNFSVQFNKPKNFSVTADGFLPLVFQSLFVFHVKNGINDRNQFNVTLSSEADSHIIAINSQGKEIPDDFREFMEGDQNIERIALDLNLFTVKLLMTRYNATILCTRDDSNSENSCKLIFPSKN